MAANYNNSAWFYDRLSMMVYGKALLHAQVYLVQFIPKNAKILIAGGGTGRILEEITRLHPGGLDITYVEIAPKMMALSQRRNVGENAIRFINDAVEKTPLPKDFDVVFTPFLFDNFTEEGFRAIFDHVHVCLKAGGSWLNCDFQLTGRWWQHVLLRSMFTFFRLICGIEGKQLPAIEKRFAHFNYQPVAQRNFFGDFVAAKVYKKALS